MKPGHRRILVFFLVDPMQRIFSATDVGPQQRGWINKATHGAGQNSTFAKLSVEPLWSPLTFRSRVQVPIRLPSLFRRR